MPTVLNNKCNSRSIKINYAVEEYLWLLSFKRNLISQLYYVSIEYSPNSKSDCSLDTGILFANGVQIIFLRAKVCSSNFSYYVLPKSYCATFTYIKICCLLHNRAILFHVIWDIPIPLKRKVMLWKKFSLLDISG